MTVCKYYAQLFVGRGNLFDETYGMKTNKNLSKGVTDKLISDP